MAEGGDQQVATQGASAPGDAQLVGAVSALATDIANAIGNAEDDAKAKGLSEADTQAAVQAAVQNAIATSGQSPRVVASAINAVKRCPTGVATSTANQPGSTLIAVHCDQALLKPLSNPAMLALGAVEGTVLALLEGDVRPASLGEGGGLPSPPSGGVASGGGSDYLP